MKPPNITNPKPERSTKPETPIQSPTMPDLEDVDIRFIYYGTSAMEVFFLKTPKLNETQTTPIQTFLCLDQNTTALPDVVELAINDNNWPQANTDIKRPERGKTQNNKSTQWTANMGSHKEKQKPDKTCPDALSRLKKRDREQETSRIE